MDAAEWTVRKKLRQIACWEFFTSTKFFPFVSTIADHKSTKSV